MKNSRVLFSSILVATFALLWCGTPILAWERALHEIKSFSLEDRKKVDAEAIALPAESLLQQQFEIWGDLTGWLASSTPLPLADEAHFADDAHRALLAKSRIVPAPEWAETVFKQLVEALPEGMRPNEYRFTLTLLDDPALSASTVGAGRVVISRGVIDAISEDELHRSDWLAFLLAREIGHTCYGHCRRGYQLQHLQQNLDDEAARHLHREQIAKLVEQCVRVSGNVVQFLYNREQVMQADLFAWQLCRNAGFEFENALDVLRSSVAAKKLAANTTGKSEPKPETEFSVPSPLARLQRLRNELDGRVAGDEYGLFEFDRQTGNFTRLPDQALRDGKRAIVFVHGIDSHFGIYERALEYFARLKQTKDVHLVCFHYPNDDSLARSGKFLRNELARVSEPTQEFDFICHSAGGLVFRYYAEVEGGAFRRAVLQGTPHAGSDLVKLRMLLEAKQFVSGLRLGMPEAMELALRDGRGQISYDLQPESLFLAYLNSRNRTELFDRYYIFRGQAIENQTGLNVLGATLAVAKIGLQTKIARSRHSELLTESAGALVDGLTIPDEISNGDLAVSLESAALKGATFMATYHVNHIALVKDPVIIKAVADIVLGGTVGQSSEK